MRQHAALPELLAPAGSLECLHAAVTAGADAVYLGLDEFNARRNADNFTLETLASACEYAHLRETKIYVTMNIEILPSELGRAIDTACAAYRAGADALIVQDVGLAAEFKRVAKGTVVVEDDDTGGTIGGGTTDTGGTEGNTGGNTGGDDDDNGTNDDGGADFN